MGEVRGEPPHKSMQNKRSQPANLLTGSSKQAQAAVGSSKPGAALQPRHRPGSTSCTGLTGRAPAPATGAKQGTANSCVSASFIRDLSWLMCQGCQICCIPTHPAPGSRPWSALMVQSSVGMSTFSRSHRAGRGERRMGQSWRWAKEKV